MLTKVSIKEIQNEMLLLLKTVNRICVENNIEYWLDHGTLLGSIRDKSFIPWDDDLDICLMQKDYKRLLICLRKEACTNKGIFLMFDSNGSNSQYWCEYLCSTKYVFGYSKEDASPVRIDIFPMKSIHVADKCKDKSITAIAQYFCRGNKKGLKNTGNKYIKKEISEALSEKKIFMLYYNETYMDSCDKNEPNSLVTYSYGDSINKNLDYFRYSDIFPLCRVKFEDGTFFAPNNSEKYLSMLYGEYRRLPPHSERNPERTAFYSCSLGGFSRQKSREYVKDLNSMFFNRNSIRRQIKSFFLILKNKGAIALMRRIFKKIACLEKK